ncbi:uncharacterized protein AUP68_12219 [Ilyonectria robusta]
MALALSQAASVKAEIRLHQALKQFSLALEPRHQAEFNIFKSQSAPTFETVIELSIQVSRDGRYQHAGGWLPKFGPRLEPLLHRIQLFSTAGDLLIGGSQNLIASGVWACVRLFLKTFMCEYLIVIVTFCHQAFQFVTQSRLKLIASALMLSFDQQFKDFEIGLERWATLMNGMVTELTTQIHVDNERALSTQSNRLASLMRINRERQFEERRLRLLKRLSPSQDEFGFIWRREQKKGSVDWAFQQDEYLAWKKSDTSATLVIVGTLGSGKTVVMANLVKDLYKSSDTESSQTSHTVVASFFCQHQTKKTLVAEVIIGSLVHQIVRSLGPDDIDLLPLSNISTTSDEMPIDFHAILSRIRQSRRQKDRRYFVAIDALDECPAEESSMVIKELVRMTKHLPLSIVLSARSESVLLDRLSRLPPVSRLSMANSTKDFEIAQYIDREIAVRVGDGKLNADIVNKIKFVLTSAAQGMYLWVALQLETIMPQHGGLVSQDNILSMLENLPRNLHEAYARGLARINDKRYGSRIFMLVAGAARPLKIKELRVALNITP